MSRNRWWGSFAGALRLLLPLAAIVGAFLGPASAAAVAPGSNGGIVFRVSQPQIDFKTNYHIWLAGPTGEDPELLATLAGGTAVPHPSGEAVAIRDYDDPNFRLVDLEGDFIRSLGTNGIHDFSPDGNLMVVRNSSQDLAIHDLSTGEITPLGVRDPDPDVQFLPGAARFTPDGKKIVFDATYKDPTVFGTTYQSIFKINVNGSGLVRLTPRGSTARSPSVSPNGTRIAHERGNSDIWVMDIDGGSAHAIKEGENVLGGRSYGQPDWSPDGTRIMRVQRFGSGDSDQGIFTSDIAGGGDLDLITEAGFGQGDNALFDPVARWLTGDGSSITGKVKDSEGDPVKGVKVVAKGKGGGQDTTAANGKYLIELPDLKKRTKFEVEPRLKGAGFKPDKRSFNVHPGETKRASFKMNGRIIEGEVSLDCSGQACSSVPVAGVTVVAKKKGKGKDYRDRSDEDGFFRMVVKKGRYVVKTVNTALKTKPKKQNVNVEGKRKKKDSADFKSCKPDAKKQRPPGTPDSNWSSSFECEDIVQIAWQQVPGTIRFRWLAAPTCTGEGNQQYVLDKLTYVYGSDRRGRQGWELMTGTKGHYVNEGADGVDFVYPAGGGSPPYQFFGQLPASSNKGWVSGEVTGKVGGADCYFFMDQARLYRQGG